MVFLYPSKEHLSLRQEGKPQFLENLLLPLANPPAKLISPVTAVAVGIEPTTFETGAQSDPKASGSG